ILASRDVEIVPVAPEQEGDALVYLVAPVLRDGRFSGALVGGIDLASGSDLVGDTSANRGFDSLVTTRDGTVVYPAKPPEFSLHSAWHGFVSTFGGEPFVQGIHLDGPKVIAGSPVAGSDLII